MRKALTFKIFVFILIGIVGCNNDGDIPFEIEVVENKVVDIGNYELLPENLAKMPYQYVNRVFYKDSLGKETSFDVVNSELRSVTGGLSKHNANGDTIVYLYSTQHKHTHLKNEEKNIRFRNTLKAQPLQSDLESKLVADIYAIYCELPEDSYSSVQVYAEVINQRSWPYTVYLETLKEVELFRKVFKNVKINMFESPKSIILFNDEFGIVSFTDL